MGQEGVGGGVFTVSVIAGVEEKAHKEEEGRASGGGGGSSEGGLWKGADRGEG